MSALGWIRCLILGRHDYEPVTLPDLPGQWGRCRWCLTCYGLDLDPREQVADRLARLTLRAASALCPLLGHDWCEWDTLHASHPAAPGEYRVCDRCFEVEERQG